eukprot:6788487-Pyramimonas_sp.AAC.1
MHLSFPEWPRGAVSKSRAGCCHVSLSRLPSSVFSKSIVLAPLSCPACCPHCVQPSNSIAVALVSEDILQPLEIGDGVVKLLNLLGIVVAFGQCRRSGALRLM